MGVVGGGFRYKYCTYTPRDASRRSAGSLEKGTIGDLQRSVISKETPIPAIQRTTGHSAP